MTVLQLHRPQYVTVADAVDGFLASRERPNTVRSYTTVLTKLIGALPAEDSADLALVDLEPGELAAAITALWGGAAPSTWNQRVRVVKSFLSYCRDERWAADDLQLGLRARNVPVDETRAIPRADLERLFARELPLREKTLWLLLYESCARASEVLNLNVEDLDLANHRADVVRKGGKKQVIHWQTTTARLLPRLTRGRRSGPLFLAHGAPAATRAPAAADTDVVTGRGRLSYSRAERLWKEATGGLTLHQLRHSALTHRAEDGVSTVLLKEMSGHSSLSSLARYARPSADAVGRAVAGLDPASRRVSG